MTPTDTSALRALEGLLNEIDRLREDNAVLRGQVARVETLRTYGWANGQQVATPQIRNALAIPAERQEGAAS